MPAIPGENPPNESGNGDRHDNGQSTAPASSTNKIAAAPASASGAAPAYSELVREPARGAESARASPPSCPDDRGVALFDSLLPGAAPRLLIPPDRTVLGVFGDPAGRRLVTIEQVHSTIRRA